MNCILLADMFDEVSATREAREEKHGSTVDKGGGFDVEGFAGAEASGWLVSSMIRGIFHLVCRLMWEHC